MSKATHYGTCQICGAEQKLPSGRLSKHGYTVDFGFFNGVCNGAHGQPFEKSTDLIEKTVARVKTHRENLIAEIEELKNTTAFVWVNVYYRGTASRLSGYRWEKFERADILLETYNERFPDAYVIPQGLKDDEKASLKARGRNARGNHHLSQFSGDTLDEKIVIENASYIRVLEAQVKKSDDYIAWQEKRVAEWVEQDLAPIAPETDGPTMHLAAERFRRASALCVGSAMAAQRFNGYTTDDESKVTCKKCLKKIEGAA